MIWAVSEGLSCLWQRCSTAVEGHQQPLLQIVFPEDPQDVESLLGLLADCSGVCGLRESNVYTGTLYMQSLYSGLGSAQLFRKPVEF